MLNAPTRGPHPVKARPGRCRGAGTGRDQDNQHPTNPDISYAQFLWITLRLLCTGPAKWVGPGHGPPSSASPNCSMNWLVTTAGIASAHPVAYFTGGITTQDYVKFLFQTRKVSP